MPTKKPVLKTDSPGREAYNNYYMHISALYRGGKWILLLLFTVFLIVMLLLFRDSITYDNLLYLTRNLNISVSADGVFASVVYEEQQNMSFAHFKGELAVAGSSGIAFYDSTGAVSLRDDTECTNPVMVSGEKYLMIYDEGGTSYSLYTPIGRVLRRTSDSAIQCADVGDSGVYAVAVRSHESKYLVTLFDSSFREVARYYRDSYVTALAVSPDGDSLAILGIKPGQSSLSGELTLCTVGSDETVELSLGDRLPLTTSYLRDGTLAVVTDGAVLFFDPEGNEKAAVSLSSMLLSCMSISDTRVALVCSENTLGTSNRVLVLNSDGAVLADTVFSEKITAVTAADGNVTAYVQSRESVTAISSVGETVGVFSYTGNLMSITEIAGRAVFCFSTGAQAPLADS